MEYLIWLLLYFFLTMSTNAKHSFISDSTYDNMDINHSISLKEMIDNHKYYLTPLDPNISPDCMRDLQSYIENLPRGTAWARQMADATPTSPHNGVFQGNIFHYPGLFSSCLKVRADNFVGQHCLMGLAATHTSRQVSQTSPYRNQNLNKLWSLKLVNDTENLVEIINTGLVKFGMCIPSTCSEKDASRGLSYFLNHVTLFQNVTISSITFNCHNVNKVVEMDSDSEFMLIVIACFAIIISIGTILDLWFTFCSTNCSLSIAIIQIFQGFSLRQNLHKIFTINTDTENLGCIHGIRFLSMTWVLIGHSFTNILFFFAGHSFVNNALDIIDPEGPFGTVAFSTIWNALASVDTFFLIGATLLSYMTLEHLDKTKGGSIKFWAMFYIHRYFRLTGVYTIVIGLHATLLKFFGFGIGSYMIEGLCKICKETWWWNILYINNFGDLLSPEMSYIEQQGCMVHTWYLAADMQFFIISPLIIYPLWKWPKVGLAISSVLLVISTCIPLVITICNETVFSGTIQFLEFYVKPWNRFQPYIIGILTGYLLHKLRSVHKLRIDWKIKSLAWIMCGVMNASVVYGTARYPPITYFFASYSQPSKLELALYNGFSKISWSLSLSWIIVACVKNVGGPINAILSWSGFVPLARLSFSIYLIHYTVIILSTNFNSYNISASILNGIYNGLSNLIISIGVALGLVLGFEAPILHLEKLLFALVGFGKMPEVRGDPVKIERFRQNKACLKATPIVNISIVIVLTIIMISFLILVET